MLDALAAAPRVTVRNRAPVRRGGSCIVYWMQRAQRGHDNPALDVAIRAGNLLEKPVVVLTTLALAGPSALRHLQFFVDGLADIAGEVAARGAHFVLRNGTQEIDAFSDEVGACLVVGDENPVRAAEAVRRRISERLPTAFWTVDADVVVPTRVIGREHWAAHTIRPRIHAELPQFLVKEPSPRARVRWASSPRRLMSSVDPRGPELDGIPVDRTVSPVAAVRGGPHAARMRLRQFVRERLAGYAQRRNRPEIDGTSGLSPYLHFGHVGPREIALAVQDAPAPEEDRAAFLEELIVRRELAVSFVRYNSAYDRLDGCERWARETLQRHARDPRHIVPVSLLASAESPDPLWNAAQAQMLENGWMHGYMRMYWAKRLLEWTRSPEEAFALAIALNDRYELDGSDPNGYAGVAWAIGGKHDRAFAERPVFGKVRYMSRAAALRKFDARAYIERFAPPNLTPHAAYPEVR